jgi:hypothetical protein
MRPEHLRSQTMSTGAWREDGEAKSRVLTKVGYRFGGRGTHTSRTIMSAELTDLLSASPSSATRANYEAAIVDQNSLGKSTTASRRLTNQRLGELYGLDETIPVFRVLRRIWSIDEAGRPLLAMMCALTRDPLLRATVEPVLSLPVGTELVRSAFLGALRDVVGARLNDAVLDKVARNAASSWSQSGHLLGRMRKIRQRVEPTPGAVAYALWLGTMEGLRGDALLSSRWTAVLDRSGQELVPLVLHAKQLGLIHARVGGGVIEIDANRLDPAWKAA